MGRRCSPSEPSEARQVGGYDELSASASAAATGRVTDDVRTDRHGGVEALYIPDLSPVRHLESDHGLFNLKTSDIGRSEASVDAQRGAHPLSWFDPY